MRMTSECISIHGNNTTQYSIRTCVSWEYRNIIIKNVINIYKCKYFVMIQNTMNYLLMNDAILLLTHIHTQNSISTT